MSNESSNLSAGTCLQSGKYKVIEVLGQGGFGITYLAEQTGLGMKVAIKEFFMKGTCTRNATTSEVLVPVTDNKDIVSKCLKKFKSEARKIASLNNDHIVNIIDVFDENGTSYYVMKYLGGGSLSKRVNGSPLEEDDAIKIISEICDALSSVHENGILHLDIKPANILFDERGRAVLIDFGVSKYVDSQKDTATTSSLVGFSRGYAPLEQMNAIGSTLTPASDIYALGATLYNLVTGITPPEASIVMNAGLPDLPSHLSNDVKNAIQESMQPRRKDRPQSIESFLSLLPDNETDVNGEETTVIAGVRPVIQAQPARGKRLPLILSSIMLSLSVIFFVLALTRPSPTPNTNNEELKVANEQIDKLRNQVSSLNSKVSTLEKQNTELKNNNTSLTSKNNKLQSENQSLKSRVDKLNEDLRRVVLQ